MPSSSGERQPLQDITPRTLPGASTVRHVIGQFVSDAPESNPIKPSTKTCPACAQKGQKREHDAVEACTDCLRHEENARHYLRKYRRLKAHFSEIENRLADSERQLRRAREEVVFYNARWVEADDKAGKLAMALRRRGDNPDMVLQEDGADSDWDSDGRY